MWLRICRPGRTFREFIKSLVSGRDFPEVVSLLGASCQTRYSHIGGSPAERRDQNDPDSGPDRLDTGTADVTDSPVGGPEEILAALLVGAAILARAEPEVVGDRASLAAAWKTDGLQIEQVSYATDVC